MASLEAVLERARDLGFLGPGPIDRHIAHADAFLAAVPDPPPSFLDLGSGGGVPGLILASVWRCTVVLLDAQERRARFLSTIPLGRFNTPEDIAHAALYLASDDAYMVTGTAFEIDGGRDI